MPLTITAVTLHRVVSDGVVILPAEAVAIVRQLWRAVDSARQAGMHGSIPPFDHVRLQSTGELRVSHELSPGGGEASVTAESITELGTALAALLSPGRAEWTANPAQLRAIVRRAIAPADRQNASDPDGPFGSGGEFLKALDDFASTDPSADLRQLFKRWHTSATAQLMNSEEVATDPPIDHTVASLTATKAEADLNQPEASLDQHHSGLDACQAALDEPKPNGDKDELESKVEEPDRRLDNALALFYSEESVAASEPLPPLARHSTSKTLAVERFVHSRWRAATLGTILAILVVATVVVFLRWPSDPPSTLEGHAVADRGHGRDPIATPTAGTLPPAPSPLPAGPALLEGADARPRGTESERISRGVAVVKSPRQTTAVPIIGSTQLENEPAYSPSFDDNESAMFFHAGRAGSLLKASMDADGSVLEVTTIVDDGARNYHVRASPDGSRIAFDSDRAGERAVYVATRDGRNVRRVSGPGYGAVPTWSPDSTRLAFIRAEPGRPRVWNIWTAEIATNELRRLTSHRVGQPWGGSWFPDGRHLAYSHEDRLVVLDTITGAERVFPSPVEGRLVRTPAVSPDGRSVVFQVFRQGAWLLDLADGATRRILEDPFAEEFAWSPDGRRIAFHSRRSGEWGIWVMAPER